MMKLTKIPQRISPDRLADQQVCYTETLKLSQFKQLITLLLKQDDNTPIDVQMQFDRDQNNRIIIHLQVKTALLLTCQSSLKNYTESFEINTLLTPITHDSEAELLPDNYDPILLEDRQLDLFNMIEEELILALPMIPKKSNHSDCVQADNSIEYRDFQGSDQANHTNPFKGLDDLIKSKQGDN